MALFSRFLGNDNPEFHSHAMAKEGSTIGAASTQSFEQRKASDNRRKMVKNFRDAGVLHNYRKDAVFTRRSDANVSHDSASIVDASTHGPQSHTTRTGGSASSRIDHPNQSSGNSWTKPRSNRQAFNAGRPTATKPVFQKPNTSFREPPTRGYNPFG